MKDIIFMRESAISRASK